MEEQEETLVELAKWLASQRFPQSNFAYLDLSDKQKLLSDAESLLKDHSDKNIHVVYNPLDRSSWPEGYGGCCLVCGKAVF